MAAEWLPLHILCMLLSYAAFLAASVSGALFLLQERQLKRKTMGWLFHWLPALGTMDRINAAAIGFGVILLTLGTLAGFWGTERVLGRWWTGDPKEVLTVALWGAYVLLWLLRLTARWRSHRGAVWSILGFSLVLLSFLGTTWLVSSGHPYFSAG